MSTGKCIRETRIRRGLTQEDVAKIVGVATQTIYKYEKEIVTNIPLGRLSKIAKALNTSVSYLLGDTDDLDDNSWRVSAVDMAFDEMIEDNSWKEAVKSAETEHLKVLYSICEGKSNYNATTKLYNREFLPMRINIVTEFLKNNEKFLRSNMPGISEDNN